MKTEPALEEQSAKSGQRLGNEPLSKPEYHQSAGGMERSTRESKKQKRCSLGTTSTER